MKDKTPFVMDSGPSDAEILIVGDFPSKEDLQHCAPFQDAAGVELTKMLHQIGIIRKECFLTHTLKYVPPRGRANSYIYPKSKASKVECEFVLGKYVHPYIAKGVRELEELIDKLQPKIIIALGSLSLWAVTGEYSITKWRGSTLQTREINGKHYPVIPTYDPRSILKTWERRYITVHDLRKAKWIRDNGIPSITEHFEIRPDYATVIGRLTSLREKADLCKGEKLDIAVDIETRWKHITCVGLAWSETEAICIPFLEIKANDKNYWRTLEEEVNIVWELRLLLTHPNVRVIGQGFSYDQQYFAREFAFIPNYKPETFHDTMTAGHLQFVGLPKSLDFLSSLFCWETHVYWKDEGKEWNSKLHSEEQHWVYNARDAVRTYAIAIAQRKSYEELNFKSTSYGSPWTIQHQSHESILRAMLRGVRIDKEKKRIAWEELSNTITKLEDYITYLAGHPLNPRSPKQLQTFFYNDFRVKPVTKYNSNTGAYGRTCDADALVTISKREVLLAPICNAINDVRSLGTFKSVCAKDLDHDGRMRCAYQVPGTETLRYNSKEDAFGYGTNLQNISEGNTKVDKDSHLYRPNLREMFIPDEGYAMCDHDLDQADARIVAWESNCVSLKEIFNDPSRDLHNEHTEIIFGSFKGPGDPNRHKAKGFVHATNYGATPPVLAVLLGITVHEAETLQRRYFGERKEVEDWHKEVKIKLQTKRYVENIFGFRRYYFDRIENLLKEALAWIPQSTVAIAVNIGIKQVERDLPWAQFLLQVHDSAVHQFPLGKDENENEEKSESIRKKMEVPLPYDDPMTIPVSGKYSLVSWGNCK